MRNIIALQTRCDCEVYLYKKSETVEKILEKSVQKILAYTQMFPNQKMDRAYFMI